MRPRYLDTKGVLMLMALSPAILVELISLCRAAVVLKRILAAVSKTDLVTLTLTFQWWSLKDEFKIKTRV